MSGGLTYQGSETIRELGVVCERIKRLWSQLIDEEGHCELLVLQMRIMIVVVWIFEDAGARERVENARPINMRPVRASLSSYFSISRQPYSSSISICFSIAQAPHYSIS